MCVLRVDCVGLGDLFLGLEFGAFPGEDCLSQQLLIAYSSLSRVESCKIFSINLGTSTAAVFV